MRIDPSTLPSECGVYLFKSSSGKVQYVGKAVNIRSRVRSHLQDTKSKKEKRLRGSSETIDWIATKSELEALVLEDTLIKRYKPKFNVRLKDDKSYPYLMITREEFPAVHQVRGLDHGKGEYFGPHSDPRAVRRSLRWLRKNFPVRSCHRDLSRPSRPCLEHHLGRCLAPCSGEVKMDLYDLVVEGLRGFLSGERVDVISRLKEEMWEASSREDFEKAALVRDILKGLERIRESQKVLLVKGGNLDVISLGDGGMVVSLVRVRDKRVVDVVSFSLEVEEPLDNPDTDLISSIYSISGQVPERIVVDDLDLTMEERSELEVFLSSKKKKKVTVRKVRGEEQRSLVELADRNSRLYMKKLEREAQGSEVLHNLKDDLHLSRVPRTIEGFDISHLHGSGTVASMVQFKDGRPNRSEYRKFRIRSAENDDFLSMKEAVHRRYRRILDEGGEMPDLILIDGGKGQLSAAVKAMEELQVRNGPDLVAIAKKEEELFRPNRSLAIKLRLTDPALLLLQRIRDESHRFAVSYQRKVREKELGSLTRIPGIGKARAKKILMEFKDLREIVDSGPDEIRRRCSIPTPAAEELIAHSRRILNE
ncbi:MAG: excinuclease ABC subunit UvrC [Thermoplasmatota archaeon]